MIRYEVVPRKREQAVVNERSERIEVDERSEEIVFRYPLGHEERVDWVSKTHKYNDLDQ